MDGTAKGRIRGSLEWRRSSHCGPHGECVELAVDGAVICVRDSKNPDGPVIRLTRAGRTAFTALLQETVRGFTGS